MRSALVAVLAAIVVLPAAAEETRLGTGVALTEATPIRTLIDRPQEFIGKTVRVDGVATAVCEHQGCWMAVAPENDPNGATVRIKVEDGVIVIPVTAKGRRVSAEGNFEVVGADAESKEAAGEHAKQDATASRQYQLKATGVVIR